MIAAPRAHVLMNQFTCACRPQESGSSISLIPFTRACTLDTNYSGMYRSVMQ